MAHASDAFDRVGRLTICALLVWATLIAVPKADAKQNEVAWNMHCEYSHSAADDPIVFPKKPGFSHMHDFFGNNSTNADTTPTSLSKNDSSCRRGFENTDHSAYWIPALYRNAELVKADPDDFTMTIYYRRGGGVDGPLVHSFPRGFRMIAGDARATEEQEDGIAGWRCNGSSRQAQDDIGLPNCSGDSHLFGFINFPSCWNGKNVDSTDHKSHVAYPTGGHSECPKSHPVKLPAITMEINYGHVSGDLSEIMVASGSHHSIHADFFNGWDASAMAALVEGCLNRGRDCTGIDRDKVSLPKTLMNPGIPVATIGAAKSARQMLEPSPATFGIAGVLAVGAAVYYLRRRAERNRSRKLLADV